jgi:phosphoribosylaminoimidazole-succinocarboxamide synthase
MVASDRVSAFDSVLPTAIPHKGNVLTQISAFWFEKTEDIVPNHVVEVINEEAQLAAYLDKSTIERHGQMLCHRSLVVHRAERIDVECVVRGYITGSAWAEYQEKGSVYGVALPTGMKEADKLPEPLFTPTTKAASGHDMPITLDEMRALIGGQLTDEIREKSLAIYNFAERFAIERDIIIADTKMEFGLIDGQLSLIDELLTPDSSRFWDAGTYSPGQSQPSFDKQYLRDWLIESGWNKEPPAPQVAPDVVEVTSRKYQEAYQRITGQKLPGAE